MRQFLTYLTQYQGAIRKFFVALGAAVAILISVWSDGEITGIEALEVGLAFLSALGVYSISNKDVPSTKKALPHHD